MRKRIALWRDLLLTDLVEFGDLLFFFLCYLDPYSRLDPYTGCSNHCTVPTKGLKYVGTAKIRYSPRPYTYRKEYGRSCIQYGWQPRRVPEYPSCEPWYLPSKSISPQVDRLWMPRFRLVSTLNTMQKLCTPATACHKPEVRGWYLVPIASGERSLKGHEQWKVSLFRLLHPTNFPTTCATIARALWWMGWSFYWKYWV